MTANGTLITLASIGPGAGYATKWLLQATNGNFYGVDTGRGTSFGAIFELSAGLGPFVETLPTSGAVGAAVTILGSNLTNATAVRFNGTPAPLTSVSATEIKTEVPTGASTGKVTVITPNGTLSSNVPFRLR